MLRRCLPYLLLLLLSSADLDDAWAFATADPADDLQAAENNEYVSGRPALESRSRPADLTPAPAPVALPADLLPCPPAGPALPTPAAGAALAASSLYVFMSLQR
jgi:hypothetical protein